MTLDLNGIERDYDIARTPHWWSERNRREAIGKALEQIPALVKELRQARAERDTLAALVPLYQAVDDYLYHAAGNNYPTGYHNSDRLEVLRETFFGMSVDSPELEGLETQPAYQELERAQAEIEYLRALVPPPELMQRLAALDEDYAKRVDEAYEVNANDRT